MFRIHKRSRSVFCVSIVLCLAILFSVVPLASAETYEEQPLFTTILSDDGNIALTYQKNITYLVEGNIPSEIELPIIITNLSDDADVMIRDISLCLSVSDSISDILEKKELKKILKSAKDKIQDKNKINDILNYPKKFFNSPLKNLSYVNMETFKIGNLYVEKGKPLSLKLVVTLESQKSKQVVEADSTVVITGLPSGLPTRYGWYCGDGHIHSTYSDGIVTIPNRVSSMKSAGLKWAIFTDHEDLVHGKWSTYCSVIADTMSQYGMPVAPALEIAVINDAGHALAYRLLEYGSEASIPDNQTLSHQALVNAINNSNSPYSFANIAHPYTSKQWTQLSSTTGFKCIELASGGAINSSAYNEWLRRLRNGEKVVGMGSTDFHLGYPDGFSWVYAPNYSASSTTPIWDAIKNGRVSVTKKGHLGVFSLNGLAIGSTISTTPGSTLNFNIVAQPCSGYTCTKWEIIKPDGSVKAYQNNPPQSSIYSCQATSTEKFYIVRFTFSDGSKVITNPIFVSV